MNPVNQKLIDAVIEKAEKICPGSLALIGIYGSVATGDEHAKSDLDLLILIQDDRGWQLGTAFILDDRQVGYDIYCTNWDGLKYDAQCHHAQISKLMDAQIVYVQNQDAYNELCQLRAQAQHILASEERFQRVDALLEKVKVAFANAHLHEDLGQVRLDAFGVIHYLANAVMLFHGRYFKRGTKRMLEELAALPLSEAFVSCIREIACSQETAELRALTKRLLSSAQQHMKREHDKSEPSKDLAGTYEEIYSNWRNKVAEAAEQKNVLAAFMNLCNLQYMLDELSDTFAIGPYKVMAEYHPDCLEENVRLFDRCLQQYEAVYQTAGIAIKRFPDVDAFVADYLQ